MHMCEQLRLLAHTHTHTGNQDLPLVPQRPAGKATKEHTVQQYSGVFHRLTSRLPPERTVGHDIPLGEGARPQLSPLCRMSPKEREEME